MSGILFFIFASCHPLILYKLTDFSTGHLFTFDFAVTNKIHESFHRLFFYKFFKRGYVFLKKESRNKISIEMSNNPVDYLSLHNKRSQVSLTDTGLAFDDRGY